MTIDAIRLYKFPTRPAKMETTIRIGDEVIARGENGRLYTTYHTAQAQGAWIRFDTRQWHAMAPVIVKLLIAIGAITKEQHDNYEAERRRERVRQDAKARLLYDRKDLARVGVHLTARQIKQLNEVARTGIVKKSARRG